MLKREAISEVLVSDWEIVALGLGIEAAGELSPAPANKALRISPSVTSPANVLCFVLTRRARPIPPASIAAIADLILDVSSILIDLINFFVAVSTILFLEVFLCLLTIMAVT